MADDPTPTPTPAPAPVPKHVDKEPEMFSADYVRELRQENARYRTKAKELEDATEKASKEAAEASTKAKAEADARIIRAELKAAALKAGMVDVDGLKLADLSKVKLTEDGEVEGADELMEALKKAKPYLFGTGNSSNPDKAPDKKKTETKSVMEMTAAEYADYRKKAIQGRL